VKFVGSGWFLENHWRRQDYCCGLSPRIFTEEKLIGSSKDYWPRSCSSFARLRSGFAQGANAYRFEILRFAQNDNALRALSATD
jgi:hypothetical protein